MGVDHVTLAADCLFVIRSTRTKDGVTTSVLYYETPSTWNSSPMEATVFQNYEAGEAHIRMMIDRDGLGSTLWTDGSREVVDVVPLLGAVLRPHPPSKE